MRLDRSDSEIARTPLVAKNNGKVPRGFGGANLEAALVGDAANDSQYHMVTRGSMPVEKMDTYFEDTGVISSIGRMNKGRFEQAPPSDKEGHSHVALSRRGSIVLSKVVDSEMVYTRVSSGATSEAARTARESGISPDDAADFAELAKAALRSPTNKSNSIANGAKTTTFEVKQDGITPFNMTVSTSMSGKGVQSSGKNHSKVMKLLTLHNTRGRGEAKAHNASQDRHSEPMGTAHTNQTRTDAGLRPLEESNTLRLVTSHDRAVCTTCGKGFSESTGHRDGSLIVGEGWRPFGGNRTGFDSKDSPSLYRVPPHETRTSDTNMRSTEAEEMRKIYQYSESEGEKDHHSHRMLDGEFNIIQQGQAKKDTQRLQQDLEATITADRTSTNRAQIEANATMAQHLREGGYRVAYNDGGHDRASCLLLALLQHQHQEYDRQHDDEATILRQDIVANFGQSEAAKLYGDGNIMEYLANQLGLHVVMLQSDANGQIAEVGAYGSPDAREAYIWDKVGHFEAVYPDPE